MSRIDQPAHCPSVSVVMATHNRAHMLEQAIESVLGQSCPDFELVIIDDGSTDQTAEVVTSFADPRIHYYYQPQAGRSNARNRGLRQALGEYIAFLDDDDVYFPDKLAVQLAYLRQHPERDLVAGGATLIDGAGEPLRDWPIWQDWPKLDIDCIPSCPLFPTIVMLRREVLYLLDHWFDQQFDLAEDTDFFIRLLLAGARMAWDRRYVAYYRIHAASSHGNARRYKEARWRLLDKLYRRDDLPAALRSRREALYAAYALAAAFQGYARGDFGAAAADYAEALAIDPGLSRGHPPRALASVAVFSHSVHVRDQKAFLQAFWKNLPRGLRYSSIQRWQTKSIVYMHRVFIANAYPDECQFTFRDWLRGVLYDPRWLTNRGVWAILLHSVAASTPPMFVGPFFQW